METESSVEETLVKEGTAIQSNSTHTFGGPPIYKPLWEVQDRPHPQGSYPQGIPDAPRAGPRVGVV